MSALWWSSLLVAAYFPVEGVHWQCAKGTGSGRIDVVVGAGALHEPETARGVAHLLEHLLFRKSNFAFRHENGKTGLDFTQYHRTTGRDALPEAAAALLAEIADPTFTEDDLTIERKVVVKELSERGLDRASGPDPLFGTTLLARSPGGRTHDVERLQLSDVVAFHQRYYGKGNVAIKVSGASDCEALRTRLQPLLRDWPAGEAAPQPTVLAKEPGQVTLPSQNFRQGYYWYASTPHERLLWVAIGEHLRLSALRELRQQQGLVYSPQLRTQRLGPGGLIELSIDAGSNGRAVARWFDETVAQLTTAVDVAQRLREPLAQVDQWLREHPEVSALAAIRAEPTPPQVLEELTDQVSAPMVARLLTNDRRFGSALAQTNVWSLLVLGIAGIVVLLFALYAGREFMQS
ncbi:MAG: insulinase family protein [Myxococcota bacterium]